MVVLAMVHYIWPQCPNNFLFIKGQSGLALKWVRSSLLAAEMAICEQYSHRIIIIFRGDVTQHSEINSFNTSLFTTAQKSGSKIPSYWCDAWELSLKYVIKHWLWGPGIEAQTGW